MHNMFELEWQQVDNSNNTETYNHCNMCKNSFKCFANLKKSMKIVKFRHH